MVFSDLFFLFFFLALQWITCLFIDETKKRNTVLLCFSLFFYAWGEPAYVLLLVGMSFIDWYLSLVIFAAKGTKRAKTALIIAVAVSVGLLGIFKYTGFIAQNLHAVFGFPAHIPSIPLPIGVSFYTFQLLSYVIDVYRADAKPARRFHELLLYSSLFYQCIAGPIVRYSDVQREIHLRRRTPKEMGKGIQRFTVGLAKKALLANSCGKIADMILLSDSKLNDSANLTECLRILSSRPALLLWLGVLFYMLQIYLDFSAYSDMAIGMGWMEGFHFKENFDYPYISDSVTDFWRRWHISLSSFFRDYVYIPLGGNRKGNLRMVLNLLVVWLLTGLWHGASWNFVLWGLYYFVFLVIEKFLLRPLQSKIPAAVRRICTLLIVYFGWILFRFRDLSYVGTVLKGLFGLNGNGFAGYEATAVLKNNIFFLIVALIAVTPFMHNLKNRFEKNSKFSKGWMRAKVVVFSVLPVVLVILSVLALVGNSFNPFLYFQF